MGRQVFANLGIWLIFIRCILGINSRNSSPANTLKYREPPGNAVSTEGARRQVEEISDFFSYLVSIHRIHTPKNRLILPIVPVYAHTDPSFPDQSTSWEPLFTPFGDDPENQCQGRHCPKCQSLDRFHGHLNKVAYLCAEFAASMFPPGSSSAQAAAEWGYLTGLWHDLGKFAEEWQKYLRSKAKTDVHRDEVVGRVDHSTAGAQYIQKRIDLFGLPLAYLIAGHHAGLADGIADTDSCLEKRLQRRIPEYLDFVPEALLEWPEKLPPIPLALRSGYSLGFFLRFLFSALVDADFLATEAFMAPQRKNVRAQSHPTIAEIEAALSAFLTQLSANAKPGKVNQIRSEILQNCLIQAELPPGLFSLTVPTGGGKTLSSLAFALKHARLNNLHRVIYVIPFTSIIEQNAAVFRKALASLGVDVVIEHHSNLDPDADHETTASRLATENWDARLIVTTNVQFFESLHANRTSRCRKLHRLARSVIILDEAQSLPIEFLKPCLRTLEELAENYRSSVVLCTATQPAITKNDDFPIGLSTPHEIIPDPTGLYQRLRRVKPRILPGKTPDDVLVSQLVDHCQVLCIVNTRRHARELFERLPDDGSRYHLSALMCPRHRTVALYRIKRRLREGKPVRLISTQLIEAGVDIDFPIVYRALAGLDSIAQSAGRCDREGLLTAAAGKPAGQLFVFDPEAAPPPGFVRSTADSAKEVLAANPPDFLALPEIENYFHTHYWKHSDSTDQKHILDCYPKRLQETSDLLCFSFKTCAENFHLIDEYTESVLVPLGRKGQAICHKLRKAFDPKEIRFLARKLQRYTVNIPKERHDRLLQAGILIPLHDHRFFLLNSDVHYSGDRGLHPEPEITFTAQSVL